MKARSSSRATRDDRPVGVVWEGPFFAHHSFANVNRAVARLLAGRSDIDLGLRADAQEAGWLGDPSAEGLTRLVGHRPAGVAWHVRHRWPPDFARPARGRFVLAQPWEFTWVPATWVDPISTSVDELWTPSAFSRDAFVRSGVDPSKIAVIPHGVDTALFNPDAAPWPTADDGAFRFLFVGGAIERKGFDLLLRAYVREFTRDDDVCLVVKDFHYGGHAGDLVRDLARRRGAPAMHYTYGTTAPERLPGLFTACDCYVHPYRGEGFGLPIAEAMACGLPVIVTGAGPAAEYCSEDVAYLIDAAEVPVPPEIWRPSLPTTRPATWYEPDVGHLRRLMRHVFEHRDEARDRGALAGERVRRHLTWERTAETIAARLRRRALTG